MPNANENIMAAIMSQPWAILPEALNLIIGIATRGIGDVDGAMAIHEARETRLTAAEELAVKSRAAVIPVFGPIFPRADSFSMVSGATSIASLSAKLDRALTDPAVDSIILNIDSPGGQVTGVHDFAKRIREANAKKPVTAFVSGMAASAAYWIACAAGRIVSDRTAKSGSIGVVYAWTDDSAARESMGLKDYVVVSSQSPNKYLDPKTPDGRKEVQRQADKLAEIFIGEVAAFRKISAARVRKEFGQGSVLLAEAALEAGMIDEIGLLDKALGMTRPVGTFALEGAAMKTKKAKAADSDEDEEKKKEDEEEARAESEEEEEEEKKGEEASDDSDSGDDEEEEKEEEKARNKAKQRQAKAQNPGVYQVAFRAGIAQERRRLREIRDLGIVGHNDLVEKAMFGQPMTAAELSYAVVKAEAAHRKNFGANLYADGAAAFAPPSPVNASASALESAEERAIIAAMAEGLD